MIRTDRWKLNLYDEGPDELFDLQDDPGEYFNLQGHPDRAQTEADLRCRLQHWHEETAAENTTRR